MHNSNSDLKDITWIKLHGQERPHLFLSLKDDKPYISMNLESVDLVTKTSQLQTKSRVSLGITIGINHAENVGNIKAVKKKVYVQFSSNYQPHKEMLNFRRYAANQRRCALPENIKEALMSLPYINNYFSDPESKKSVKCDLIHQQGGVYEIDLSSII